MSAEEPLLAGHGDDSSEGAPAEAPQTSLSGDGEGEGEGAGDRAVFGCELPEPVIATCEAPATPEDLRAMENVIMDEDSDWMWVRREMDKRSFKINAWKNEDGNTLLQLAVRRGNHNIVQFLVERGADPNDAGSNPQGGGKGQLPLVTAVSRANANIVLTLLAYGANPQLKDGSGLSALVVAQQQCPNWHGSEGKPMPSVRDEICDAGSQELLKACRWNIVRLLAQSMGEDRPIKPMPLEEKPDEKPRPRPPQGPPCTECRTPGARLICMGCNGAIYCDKQCQRRHWKAGHKDECKGAKNSDIPKEEAALREALARKNGTCKPAGGGKSGQKNLLAKKEDEQVHQRIFRVLWTDAPWAFRLWLLAVSGAAMSTAVAVALGH